MIDLSSEGGHGALLFVIGQTQIVMEDFEFGDAVLKLDGFRMGVRPLVCGGSFRLDDSPATKHDCSEL